MDGKQARRTKQGSPLGMLFDHGCDAMNGFISAISISKLFYVTNFQQSVAVTVIMALAYMATIEQYITDFFYLPIVNSVNEGILFLLFTQLLGAYLGGPFWREVNFSGLRNNDLMLIFMVLGGLYNLADQYSPLKQHQELPEVQTSPPNMGRHTLPRRHQHHVHPRLLSLPLQPEPT